MGLTFNKDLLISVLFFILSLWMATYIFLPYFAIGGIEYLAYDLNNPINIVLNIVIPVIMFCVFLFFANYFYKKTLSIANGLFLCIIQIIISSLLIVILIVLGIMVISVYSNITNWVIGYIAAFVSVVNFFVWSIVSLKKKTSKSN